MFVQRSCRGVDRPLGCREGDLSDEAGRVRVHKRAALLHITRGRSSPSRLGCFGPVYLHPGEPAQLERGNNTTSRTQLMSSNNLTDDADALTRPTHPVFTRLPSDLRPFCLLMPNQLSRAHMIKSYFGVNELRVSTCIKPIAGWQHQELIYICFCLLGLMW